MERMVRKFRMLRAVSVLLIVVSIGFSVYNYNGAFSYQYKVAAPVVFYLSVWIPVVLAVLALILAVMAWSIARTYKGDDAKDD